MGWLDKLESGGGLKRSEDYGSKSKPYPMVDKSDFAGGGRSYPIPTRADAVDALKLAGLHGRADVKQKVYSKYPDLKKSQNGGRKFLQPNDKKLPKGKNPQGGNSSELAMSIGGEDGEPAYLIPSFKHGKPLFDPYQEYGKTGEHLGGPFKTWQEADKWENEVRHPAVEQGRSIIPYKYWGEGMKNGGWLDQLAEGGSVEDRRKPVRGDVDYKPYSEIQDFEADYIQSPKYAERLNKSGYKNPKKVIKERLNELDRTRILEGEDYYYGAHYNPGGRFIKTSPNVTRQAFMEDPTIKNLPSNDEIVSHEISHSGHTREELNKYDLEQLKNRLLPEVRQKKQLVNWKGEPSRKVVRWHDQDPNENKSDLDAVRYQLMKRGIMNPGTEDVTQEHLDKIQDSGLKQRLENNYSKDDLLWLMNNIAARNEKGSPTVAQNGIEKMSSRKLRGINLMLAEEEKKKKDIQELHSKGNIKHPRSLKYQRAPLAEVRKHVPQHEADKQLEQMANPMTAMGYIARNQEIPEHLSKAIVSGGANRNPLDYAVDIINPAGIAEGIANIPRDISEGNYLGAGINAITALPMLHEIGPEIKQAFKPGMELASDLAKAKSFREGVARTFKGVPITKNLPRVGKADLKAMRQVQEIGLMGDLEEKTNRELLQHALDQNIPDEHLQKVFGKTRKQIEEHLAIPEGPNPHAGTTIDLSRPTPEAHRELERQARERREEILRRRSGPDVPPTTDPTGMPIQGQRAGHFDLSRSSEQVDPLESLDEDDMTGFADMFRARLSPERQARMDAINSQREQELAAEFGGGEEDELNSMFNAMPASMRDRLAAINQRAQAPTINQPSDIDIESLLGQMASRPRTTDIGRDIQASAPRRTRTITDAQNVQRSDDLLARMRAEAAGELDPHGNPMTDINDWMSQQQAPPMTLAGKAQDAQQVARGLAEKTGKKAESLIDKYSQAYPSYSGPVKENVPFLTAKAAGSRKEIQRLVAEAREKLEAMPSGTVASGSLNTSHSSWLPQLKEVFSSPHGEPKFLGHHNMNEMGYLSDAGYSPQEISSYLNTEIDEMIRKKRLPKDVSRPFEKEGKVVLPHYGIQRHKDGGIIEDEMGQWAHPGKVTKIPSNRITMKGVPYPVLGISNTGDKKLMQPGKEYKFKGSSVTEYPKGKNGSELTKLDQLTNFTNYNKPTKGGWLDKL